MRQSHPGASIYKNQSNEEGYQMILHSVTVSGPFGIRVVCHYFYLGVTVHRAVDTLAILHAGVESHHSVERIS